MSKNIKNYLALKFPLKLVSVLFSYALWCIMSSSQIVHHSYQATLTFYNAPASTTITAPETVTVVLQGKRSILRHVNPDRLTAHIDAQTLKKGTHHLQLDNATIFLPESIKLVHYSPTPITVQHMCT